MIDNVFVLMIFNLFFIFFVGIFSLYNSGWSFVDAAQWAKKWVELEMGANFSYKCGRQLLYTPLEI